MVFLAVVAAVPVAQLATGLGLGMGGRSGGALLVALLIAPWIEELVLRNGLQRGLGTAWQRCGSTPGAAAWRAALVCTLAFALVHLPAWSLDGLLACTPWLLPGAALAAAWCWRQRTLDCVLLHAFFNLALWWVGPRSV